MSLRSWLQSIFSNSFSCSRRRKRRHLTTLQASHVECLEHRVLLSASGWSETIEGPSWSNARFALNVDTDENIYMATAFTGTVDVDFGPGGFELTEAINASGDIAIAKYTKDRQLVWATSFGGGDRDLVKDIEFDASGNVYVTGRFYSGTIHFGPIALTNNDSGTADAYVAKLDPNGNFLWAHNFGGIDTDYGTDLTLTPEGDVLIAGQIRTQADFDPDPNSETIVTGFGGRDAVLWKLDSDGNFQWVKHYGSPGENEQIYSVETDVLGNIYVSGPFSESVNFGSAANPLVLTSATTGFDDTFLLKLDSNGETIWARQISGPDDVRSEFTLSDNGALYVSGSFGVSADFGAGQPTLHAGEGRDIFMSRWNTDGQLEWVKQISGTGDTHGGISLDTDSADNVYLTAYFKGDVDLDPDPVDTFGVTSFGFDPNATTNNLDGYLVELSALGEFVSGYHVSGPEHVRSERVAIAPDGDIYTMGTFQGTATLPLGDVVTAVGSRDTYLTKISRAPGVTIFPASGLTTTETGGTAAFDVVLDLAPTADVTIALSSSDESEGLVSPSTLTFTPANWNVPQSVTITGVDDIGEDGDVAYTIVTAPAVSADASYSGMDAGDIFVTNLDVELPLFADSFEVSEWNGNWVEDAQNDWFRSSQRSIDGSFSAEIDGNAADATLAVANEIDLTPFDGAELTFSWYIENGFDSGEYIALDLYDGSQWIEVRRLRGNVDQENTWHNETVTVEGGFLVRDFNFRFRGYVNNSREDGFVDNVRLMPTSFAGPPNQLPTADAGGSYSATEGVAIVLDGSASSDPDGAIVSYAWDLDNDGQYDDATGVNPSFIPLSPGAVIVGLQVTDDRGGIATDTAVVNVTNVGPTADAGGPYTGNEGGSITLDASGSTEPGNDLTYDWDLDGDGQFDDAVGVTVGFINTSDGLYNIAVRVTDDGGATDIAATTVTVNNVAPTADAGGPYATQQDVAVMLSAAGSSDPGNDIVSYEWDLDNDGFFDDAVGVTTSFSSSVVGDYPVAVRITDDDGASSIAATTVSVSEVGGEVVVFEDSFEVGEWIGNWVEDGQDDWFRSSQRASDGSWSAEISGRTTDGTLTLANAFDLSSFGVATLTFSWYIESSFDSGEYILAEISADGGANWTEVARLDGEVDQENTWHDETVDLAQNLTSNVLIRFRGTANRGNEDANVDNVKITASGTPMMSLGMLGLEDEEGSDLLGF